MLVLLVARPVAWAVAFRCTFGSTPVAVHICVALYICTFVFIRASVHILKSGRSGAAGGWGFGPARGVTCLPLAVFWALGCAGSLFLPWFRAAGALRLLPSLFSHRDGELLAFGGICRPAPDSWIPRSKPLQGGVQKLTKAFDGVPRFPLPQAPPGGWMGTVGW